jgi:hypothetical protein
VSVYRCIFNTSRCTDVRSDIFHLVIFFSKILIIILFSKLCSE